MVDVWHFDTIFPCLSSPCNSSFCFFIATFDAAFGSFNSFPVCLICTLCLCLHRQNHGVGLKLNESGPQKSPADGAEVCCQFTW